MNNFFICIGAQKAGTTWLDANLRHHPMINLPPIKELHFFDEIEHNHSQLHRLTSSHLLDIVWRYKLKNSIINLLKCKDMKNQLWKINFLLIPRKFNYIPKYKYCIESLRKFEKNIVGEITPAYSTLSPESIFHIQKYFPKLKIIFILRNPVDRDWSQIKMNFLKFHKKKFMDKNLDEIKKFIGKKNKRSQYLDTINNWTRYYPQKQIHICFYDELVDSPLTFLNKILAFLGVEKVTKIPVSKFINQGRNLQIPKNINQKLVQKNKKLIEEMSVFFQDEEINYPLTWLNKIK